MKLKISEVFDDSFVDTDYIKLSEATDIDKNRIKQLTMEKINKQQAVRAEKAPKRKMSLRLILVAAAVATVFVSAFIVNAATGGKLFGAVILNSGNRYLAYEQNYAMSEVAATDSEKQYKKPVLYNNIISKDYLDSLNAGTITNIVTKEKGNIYTIPEIRTSNGDIVVFTKEGELGWCLKKGDELTLNYKLDVISNKQSDVNGENMEVGYIKNGKPVKGYFKKAKEFKYTIKADEDGDYYFYAENYCSGYIIIQSGSIN